MSLLWRELTVYSPFVHTSLTKLSFSRAIPTIVMRIRTALKYLWWFFAVITIGSADTGLNLTSKLFAEYQRGVRPAKGFHESVRVRFKLLLNELIDVDEVSQKIESKTWLYHRWRDLRLTWNPAEYDGIEYIRIPAEKIWLPIFVLYNNADGDFAISDARQVRIFYNGTIEWMPPAMYRSFCEIQVANFPFDTQNCTMKIGPWTRGMDLLDMVNMDGYVKDHLCDSPDISDYSPNGEWKLLSTGCYKHYIFYNCCVGPYVDMTYHFVIQRRPLYLLMNILLPTILFTALTSAVFYLPSDGAEKMTLSVSLLLTLVLFLLIIMDTIPSTANGVPLLGKYILFTMVLVTLSIVITIFVLNINYRTHSTHCMPRWMRKVFLHILPRNMLTISIKLVDGTESSNTNKVKMENIADISGRNRGKDSSFMINPDSRKAIEDADMIAKHYKWQEDKFQGETDWKYIAMVMDRYLLKIFLVLCVLGTIFVFVKRLHEMSYEEEMFVTNDRKCLLNC